MTIQIVTAGHKDMDDFFNPNVVTNNLTEPSHLSTWLQLS